MGYIDEETYKPYLLKAVDGIFNEFIRIDGDYAYLKNCCAVAGLGPDDITDVTEALIITSASRLPRTTVKVLDHSFCSPQIIFINYYKIAQRQKSL